MKPPTTTSAEVPLSREDKAGLAIFALATAIALVLLLLPAVATWFVWNEIIIKHFELPKLGFFEVLGIVVVLSWIGGLFGRVKHLS